MIESNTNSEPYGKFTPNPNEKKKFKELPKGLKGEELIKISIENSLLIMLTKDFIDSLEDRSRDK